MILAFDGSAIDGSSYRYVTGLAQESPSWFDGLVSFWSSYGLGLFAVLMVLAWLLGNDQSPGAGHASSVFTCRL